MAANRRFVSQFSYSYERQPVKLMSSFIQSGSAGTAAVLVNNGITWTAATFGAAGNSITVALVAGGTAGSEVVSVSGNAISVAIESGVSTRTQVLTAVQASAAASALVSISVSSGGTAATLLAATALATGTSAVFTVPNGGQSQMVMTQIGTGLYKIALSDAYAALLGASISMFLPTAKDLKAQISVNASATAAAPYIIIRTVAVGTATNMASGDGMFVELTLRNSANPS